MCAFKSLKATAWMSFWSFLGKNSEMDCPCLLLRAKREGLANGHFKPKVGLEL